MDKKTLRKKLGMKAGYRMALVNPPGSFVLKMSNDPFPGTAAPRSDGKLDFIHIFAVTQSDIERFSPAAVHALAENGILWVSYPKKSGSIRSDITRDEGWDSLKKLGFRPVTLVSLDDDWSALRFKPAGKVASRTISTPLVDAKAKTVTLPPDLRKALKAKPGALGRFEGLAWTHRKEYVLGIEGAKKAETRAARIEKTVKAVFSKKK
jgi:hypothetical protein